MQRSEPLIPLSQDHHHGLVAARRIRQLLNDGSETNGIAEYLANFWDAHLDEHFREEEQIIFPLLPQGHEMVSRAINDHRRLAEIKDMLPESDNEKQTALLNEFAATLREHIRFEERVLFPEIEQKADPEALGKAGKLLIAAAGQTR